MFEAFIIYLYTVLSGAKALSVTTLVIAFPVLVLGFILADLSEERSKYLNFVKAIPKWIPVLLITIVVLVPSKDDLKFIIGGAVAWTGLQAASEIKGVEKLPENIVNAMNYFLEEVTEKKEK